MKFFGRVVNGELKVTNRAIMANHIVSLDGQEVEVEITKRSKRTTQQNRYWWSLMTILHKEHPAAMEKEDWHEVCKMKFLKRERVDEVTGEVIEYLKSTTELDRTEFKELIEKLQIWASTSWGIVLPDPEQQTEIDI